jgi:abortive infection Abi-like protein
MITLYESGGADDFAIDGKTPGTNDQSVLGHARRLLRARGHASAASILEATPFAIREASNHFMDEFNVLFAAVPLEMYERIRRGVDDWEQQLAYREVAEVMVELGASVRFIAVELDMRDVSKEDEARKLKNPEILKLVHKYIGVSSGYLADFSYRTHHEFYIELDLDINPSQLLGTTKERFIQILTENSPEIQARILKGVLARFPVGSSPLRTKERAEEVEIWIARLTGAPRVDAPDLRVTSEVVQRALRDAEHLLRTNGATSGVDRVHTALHGYCIALCLESGIEAADEAGMTELFKLLSQRHPAFGDMGPRKEDVLRILRALAVILDALNPLRNKTSVAHPNAELLPEPEAMLAINCARSILHYLDQKSGTTVAARHTGSEAKT